MEMNTIDAYIDAQDEAIRPLLRQLHKTIRDVLPEAEERISWRMPTFWDGQNIIHFAAFKKHVGIYPGPDAIVHFAEGLAGYKTSKGAIQLPLSEPLPLALVAEIAKWCYENGKHH